jgi:hypothetical protein
MVQSAWHLHDYETNDVTGLWSRLKQVSSDIHRWSTDVFGSVYKEIKFLKNSLEDAKAAALSGGYVANTVDVEKRLHELYEREEVMYRQRSRVEWLKAGDRNTRYFHNRASHRRRKNTVRALRDGDGGWCTTDDSMRQLALAFYRNLYTSEGSDETISNLVLDKIPSSVT